MYRRMANHFDCKIKKELIRLYAGFALYIHHKGKHTDIALPNHINNLRSTRGLNSQHESKLLFLSLYEVFLYISTYTNGKDQQIL